MCSLEKYRPEAHVSKSDKLERPKLGETGKASFAGEMAEKERKQKKQEIAEEEALVIREKRFVRVRKVRPPRS